MSHTPHGFAALALGAALLLAGCSAGADRSHAGPAERRTAAGRDDRHGHETGHRGHQGHAGHEGMSATPQANSPTAKRPGTAPAPLTRIADAIGCKAAVTTDAEELRQGACRTGAGEFRMVTFADEVGRRAWLTEAQAYGGTYLVGDRWVVTSQPSAALAGLRGKLGGTVESGASHHGM